MVNTFYRLRNIEIEVYNTCKYNKDSEVAHIIPYKDAQSFEVFNADTAADRVAEIEASGLVDDYHEYLTVYFADGSEATFRNSYVDMFTV